LASIKYVKKLVCFVVQLLERKKERERERDMIFKLSLPADVQLSYCALYNIQVTKLIQPNSFKSSL